ncbi:MAG: ATP synthase F0 subunit B [Pseudomonadota bacterium]
MRGRLNRDRAPINSKLIGALSLFNLLFYLTVAYASGGGAEGGDEGPGWVKFAWKLSNLLIIAGVIYWLTAKKVKEFFTGRQEGIKTSLAEAVTAREDAEKKFREYAAKLDQATGEIDEITRMIQAQGLTEKERIIGEARKAAEKMKEETQARMEQEFNKSSHQLRIEAVRLSAQMAEGLLRQNIRVEDHEAMVQDYIEKVVRKN